MEERTAQKVRTNGPGPARIQGHRKMFLVGLGHGEIWVDAS